MSYLDTLASAECQNTAEATGRKPRATPVGFTARMESGRVPEYLLYGELFKGKWAIMAHWKHMTRCLGDDTKAFGADKRVRLPMPRQRVGVKLG